MSSEIFVFGSNYAGRHGKGSALEALRNHGAVYGCGVGPQGNSYAIPTKDHKLNVYTLRDIEYFVERFKLYAAVHRQLTFNVVPIGCGLAGYKPEQIGPMFRGCTSNVNLPAEFIPYVK